MFKTFSALTFSLLVLTATVAVGEPSSDRGRGRDRGGRIPQVDRDCSEGRGRSHDPLRRRNCARRNVDPPVDWAEVDALAEVLQRAETPSREAMARLQAPPEQRPDDEPRSWDLMDELAADMRSLDERSRRDQPLLRRAIRRVEEASASQRELDSGRTRPLARLQLAAQDLEAAMAAGQVRARAADVFLRRIAAIGRSLAVEVIELVESRGAPRGRVAELVALVELSDELMVSAPIPDGFPPLMEAASSYANLKFNREEFIQNIRDTFDDETVGYAFSIVEDGVVVHADAVGLARKAEDAPFQFQSPSYRMNVASVSKTITATAVLQLLQEKGISPTSSIIDWLPPSWEPDESIEQVTFLNLMNHRSGLDQNRNRSYNYDRLKSYIEADDASTAEDRAVYQYQNTNFALFRVILPYLWGYDPAEVLPSFSADVAHAAFYIVYVREYVLRPAGVLTADCDQDPTSAPLEYNFDDPTVASTHPGDWRLLAGGGGWYLSAEELGEFLAALSNDGTLLPPGVRAYMDAQFAGWNNPEDWSWGYGNHGVYRNHGGDLGVDEDPGMGACVMKYTNGIQAALLINSRLGGHAYQCIELRDAFDASWGWED
ncbi:MAG: serine hydrolase [Acidobacteriota bacterium]